MPAQEARPILFHGIDVDGAEEFPFRAQCRHIKGDDHVLAEHGRIVGGEVRPFDLPAPDAVAYAGSAGKRDAPLCGFLHHRAVDIRTGNTGAEHVERQHFEAQVVGAGAADARVHVLAYVDHARGDAPVPAVAAGIFDPEIAEALCKAMRRSCTVEPLAFGTLLEKMRRGELDMIVAGLAKNEQRLAYMDFTNSYYHSRSIYLGLPGSVTVSAEGLKGKRVGVQDHTQQEIFLRRHWVNVAEIIRFPTYEQLLDAFCAGQLDVILVDGLSGYEFLQSERGQPFAILDDPLPPDEDLAYAHIGVRKNNPELVDAINEAIVHIKLNGDYDRIVRKYFPFSIY